MGEGRGKGLHLGHVLRHIEKVGLRKQYAEYSATQGALFQAMGFMFETIITEAFRNYMGFSRTGMIVRPDEILKDGIYLNPDALDIDEECLEEYKATWRSSNKLREFEHWFQTWAWQMMAYCYAMGLYKARLIIFFINGDYSFRKGTGGPQIKCLEFFFTEAELFDNWQMILEHAEDARKEMEAA